MRDGALADPNGAFGIGIQNLGLLRSSNPLIPEFCPAPARTRLPREHAEVLPAEKRTNRCHRQGCHLRGVLEGKLEAPKHLARTVHDLYFEPKYDEFRPRMIWSLPNAFTSAFKEVDPIPQFKATSKLGEFLEARFSQSFSANVVSAERPLLITITFY